MSNQVLVRVCLDHGSPDLTYAWPADSDPKIGDRVVLPEPFWWPDKGLVPCEGTVTGIGSDYDGPVRAVRSVLP